ncbi:MAG: winged helix-turn-helix transcriptional regulator [Archaeoglobaceae archaeon]|nr:winged helix-turn-helix transcriptional regulator [Archaeoglobaceae archaeon]MDW8128814.1 winged helix-turn-helix transcriptional regulator [Archaeoglobaceae archaeon]
MILINKKDVTRLLILSELLLNPECNQRDIAKKLDLTPQAISEHFKELVAENLIKVVHRGYYELTSKGEEWLSKNLLDLHVFSEELLKKVYSKSIVTIAVGSVKEGEKVRYWFEDGFIFAKKDLEGNGVALTSAEDGEDLLIKPTGIFEPPQKGEIIIVKVPNVGEGGSRKLDLKGFGELVRTKRKSILVAMGIEALIACRKIRVEPIFFGAKEVCIEASHHGCGVIVACAEDRINDLLRSLIEEGLKFEIKEF